MTAAAGTLIGKILLPNGASGGQGRLAARVFAESGASLAVETVREGFGGLDVLINVDGGVSA